QPLRIGADSQTSTNYFNGEIDEVRVWDRALSASEATAQYDSGIYNATGARLHITMQEVPIAEAGPIQLIMDNATTGYLNAKGSIDPDGSGPLTYAWTQVSGPAVTLSGSNTITPSFSVMNVTGEKKLTFKVIPSHAKVAIIDNKTLFVGSANLNNNGLNNNWEMTLKTNNPDTMSEAYRFLDVMWKTGSKVTDNVDKYYERFVNGNEHYNLLIDYIKNAHSIKVLMFEVTYNSENP